MPNRLAELGKALARSLAGPALNEPRKGSAPLNAGISAGSLKPEQPNYILATTALKSLAERDDIIVALRRVLRNAIGGLQWHIVPDIAGIESDVKRWKATVELNLSMPGLHVGFTPQAMSPEFFASATEALRNILIEEQQLGTDFKFSARLHEFFENILATHKVIAESHVAPVKALLERPNAAETWRTFISQVVDSLTLYDCAAIVKNPKLDTDEIGELYLLPAEDIRVYRRDDRSQPRPPFAAYDWSENDRLRAYFNAVELCYVMANPQGTGYGTPPLQVLISMMLSSISADKYILEFFQNNNMPAGLFDLGPNVSAGERDAVERKWNSEVRKGIRRIAFVSLQDGVKGFVPIPQTTMRDNEQIALMDMWTKRKAAVFGLSPNDIGHTQDMHLANAEQQAELTQNRGVESLAKIIELEINTNIIKGQMWRRKNPEDVNDMHGYAVPVFPFNDVRFEFITGTTEDDKDQTESDQRLFAMGVLSTNEIRKKLNLPPVPGGDEHIIAQPVTMRVEDLPALPMQNAVDPTQMPSRREEGFGQPENRLASPQQPLALPDSRRPNPASQNEAEKRLTAFAKKLHDVISKGS